MTAVRTLLTVAVAVALLGATLPVVDDARVDRTAARLDATALRVVDAARALVASDDPVPAGDAGAGRTLVVTLPHAGVADARAAYLSIGGVPTAPSPSVVGYRVAGRPPQRLSTDVAFVTGSDPLVLAPGRHRLRLTLVRTREGVGVRVRPLGRRVADDDDPSPGRTRASESVSR